VPGPFFCGNNIRIIDMGTDKFGWCGDASEFYLYLLEEYLKDIRKDDSNPARE
jgi:hypothetical protein